MAIQLLIVCGLSLWLAILTLAVDSREGSDDTRRGRAAGSLRPGRGRNASPAADEQAVR